MRSIWPTMRTSLVGYMHVPGPNLEFATSDVMRRQGMWLAWDHAWAYAASVKRLW